ncbi:Suppressor protein MPT5 [Nakaseomyces bracarensis]|uniref:Suppressor protein MPT5 n=1 Tax=Nakaseomyces bracarensis TaxID=273131 RepID=A0ABR4P0V4_9SACH
MSYNHQPHLSINSIQSLIEPVTPPSLGQMNNKKNHQKTHSLDLSVFNQFMSANTPLNNINTSGSSTQTSPLDTQKDFQQRTQLPGYNAGVSMGLLNNLSHSLNPASLPQIDEFDIAFDVANVASSSNIQTDSLNSVPLLDRGADASSGIISPPTLELSNLSLSSNISNTYSTQDNNKSMADNNKVAAKEEKNKNKKQNIGSKSGLETKNRIPSKGSESETHNLSVSEISNTPLEDLDYVKLATDQFGCRFLQKKLETPSESDIVRDLMYEQIKPYFLDLILDPFGNYLIQKLCDFLTSDQRTSLIDKIYPHVFQISINQYGTRSLQKIIDTVDNETQIDLIVRGFSKDHTSIKQVVTLINDLNGNHVIQKCIFKFPPSKFEFIINAIIEQNNIITISTHKHGCCVLQKLLSVCTLQQTFKISVKIVQFLPGLINDQFGNYIIQFLLDIEELDFYLLAEFYNRLSNEVCQLSCLKFSSNVVEKFIKKLFGIISKVIDLCQNSYDEIRKNGFTNGIILPVTITEDVLNSAVNILVKLVDNFTLNLNLLIRDNFGNYALQTLLDIKNYGKIISFNENIKVQTLIIEDNLLNSMIGKLSNLSTEFGARINNIVILTKELLPSIKTTSYAKKIKLKVKAYAEFTGVPFTELSPRKQTTQSVSSPKQPVHSNNSNKNRLYPQDAARPGKPMAFGRQHTRHYSLPANAYQKRSPNPTNKPFYNQQVAAQTEMAPNYYGKEMYSQPMNQQLPIGIQTQQRYVMNGANLNGMTSMQPATMGMVSDPTQTLNIPNFAINTTSQFPANTVIQQPNSAQSSIFMMNDNSISGGSSSTTLYQNGNIVSMNDQVNTQASPVFNGMMYQNDVSDHNRQRIISNPFPQYGYVKGFQASNQTYQNNSDNGNDSFDNTNYGYGFQ